MNKIQMNSNNNPNKLVGTVRPNRHSKSNKDLSRSFPPLEYKMSKSKEAYFAAPHSKKIQAIPRTAYSFESFDLIT